MCEPIRQGGADYEWPYTWLRHPDDFRTALAAALDCGGDTDTVGAILGALSGVAVGKTAIPIEWLNGF
jgi:ADP-ribosyl-[dinitrogen reductase] hydrolase